MKYQSLDLMVPHEKRAAVNTKILSLIDSSNIHDFTPNDIFNCYTGEGGLHGLSLNEFDNFHQYSEAKKEIEQGQFFTPHSICQEMVSLIRPGKHDLIADLTCGSGNFFNYLPEEKNIYGCDIDSKAIRVAKFLYPDATIECKDIRLSQPPVSFDFVIGNPPFNLKWAYEREEYLSQLFYCKKAFEVLKPGGILLLITPLSFLGDDFKDKSMINEINELFNFIVQYRLDKHSFASSGVENFETKILAFQKRSEHLNVTPYKHDSFAQGNPEEIFENYFRPVLEQKEKLKGRFFQEINKRSNLNNWSFKDRLNNEDEGFHFQVRKFLYEIKNHPSLEGYYAKCLDQLEKLQTQKKPVDMDWKEWDKVKLTENKVLAYLGRTLKKQNKKEVDKIELVKTNYGLNYKAYSEKSKKKLYDLYKKTYYPFNDLILNFPVELPGIEGRELSPLTEKLISKKRKAFLTQNYSFKQLERNSKVDEFIQSFRFFGKNGGEAKFNDIQLCDLGLIFQKRYAELNWQQGSGKTPGTYAWACYHRGNTRNTFVVSAALAINLTWEPFLKKHKENFIKITCLHDIYRIQEGQFVIISLNMLSKYQKQLKKYIRTISYKAALIFDESDEITNHRSGKTKAVLNCFRKLKYKLNATGTTTRNNINELYPQLELLYNNSVNMICWCGTIYKETLVEKKGKVILAKFNDHYGKPFPAYFGNGLFKSCFSPSKTTVFGVEKQNQDIYNMEELREIIEKTIITRKFKEIAGLDRYKIITHGIEQNPSEEAVYSAIINEFHRIAPLFFKSTGNSRKDALLKIIQQINLLIKATSVPQIFKEYSSKDIPGKFHKIFELIEGFAYEQVAIGSTTLDASDLYYHHLKNRFPFRKVFLIQGDVSFNGRKDIIDEFQATPNGILICTQQSLKSSVNIPSCSKVIIESLQWNIPKMEQFYFRFIRYDSPRPTEVHIVNYQDTIEQNILALLMAKERVNDFIKTLEYKEQADIFGEFDIDISIFDQIIRKEKGEDGRVSLRWGHQKVS